MLKRRSPYATYSIAVLAIAAAVLLTLLIRFIFTLNPTPLILVGVIFASWYGGRYPGLLSCVVADIAIDFFFEEPLYEFTLSPVHIVRLLILGVVSILTSSRKNAENKLRIREQQQAAVAKFGHLALSGVPVSKLLSVAVEVVRETLEVPYAGICELLPDNKTLRYVATSGWPNNVIGLELDGDPQKSLPGRIIESGTPLVAKDLDRRTDLQPSDALKRLGVRSGVGVQITSREKPFGVLGGFDTMSRTFSRDDINFLQSIANVIAEAVNRLKAEDEVREQRTWLNTTLSSIGDAVIATDVDGNIEFMNRVAEKMTGWDQTEARGMPLDKVFRIMNEETRQFVISPVTKVLSSGEVVGLANHTVLVARDGTEIPIDDSAAPITDEGVIRGVVLVFSDVSARKAAERSLREKEIMERLVGAQEAERHRIARDLHDHLGQKMTALRLKIESLSRHAEEVPGIAAAINDARASAAQIDQDIGFLSWELMPTELHQLGLEDALSSFVREWSAQYGIPAEFHSQIAGPDGDGGRFSPEIETNLYRIVQEALHNIVKHSRSSQANVLLHHRDRVISLIVEDDGVGFDGSQNGSRNGRGGMGLTGMKERAALLGGSLEIESRAGEGTTLIVRIPLS